MKIFTIAAGRVETGARVDALTLGSGDRIPAILIGEAGRGRLLGVMPVAGLPMAPCSRQGGLSGRLMLGRPCEECGVAYIEKPYADGSAGVVHPDAGERLAKATLSGTLGATRAGKPKLFATADPGDPDTAIVVIRCPIGYRGGNALTGDRTGWKCSRYGCTGAGTEIAEPETCPMCAASPTYDPESLSYRARPDITFAPFPGHILVRGEIAQGDAGRAGAGGQWIATVAVGQVFRTAYYGRLYGGPSSHYYRFDGEKVQVVTWAEREAADLWFGPADKEALA